MVLVWHVMRGPKVLKCLEVFKYYVSRLKIKIKAHIILEHFQGPLWVLDTLSPIPRCQIVTPTILVSFRGLEEFNYYVSSL